jgi:hypothetical protein
VVVVVIGGCPSPTQPTAARSSDLWAAAWQGQTEVVRYLVGTDGVEINRARSDPAGENLTPDIPGPGTTPLQITELEGRTECATILRAAGAV